ncbi:unnamed protein product [Cyclocybe aegerita]|uniref:Uncharacterized protein n=1 Tax=Cyclocybe aegerita TaxID=1973307 RepID=A0A8S0VU28_CYCAE|nr:unnamed protein product [Cyclocybe aegerita]
MDSARPLHAVPGVLQDVPSITGTVHVAEDKEKAGALAAPRRGVSYIKKPPLSLKNLLEEDVRSISLREEIRNQVWGDVELSVYDDAKEHPYRNAQTIFPRVRFGFGSRRRIRDRNVL